MAKKKGKFAEYFDGDYFAGKKGGGVVRNEDGGMYYGQAMAFQEIIGARKENGDNRSFLHVGCGVGFVVRHLKNLLFNARGIDISGWAIDNSVIDEVEQGDVRRLTKEVGTFDVVFCDAVLEYLSAADIDKALKQLSKTAREFVVVSVIASDHKDLGTIESSKKEIETIQPKEWWLKKFQAAKLVVDEGLSAKFAKYEWDCAWVLKKQ